MDCRFYFDIETGSTLKRASTESTPSRKERSQGSLPRLGGEAFVRPCKPRRDSYRPDYLPGYEKARAIDRNRADNYIAHTLIGGPEGDAVTEYFASLEQQEAARLTGLILESRDVSDLPDDSPAVIRDFVRSCDAKPDWVDFPAFTPGRRMFYRNSGVTLAAMLGGVLIECFAVR